MENPLAPPLLLDHLLASRGILVAIVATAGCHLVLAPLLGWV